MTSITRIISEPNTGKVQRLWHAKKTSHTMQEIEKKTIAFYVFHSLIFLTGFFGKNLKKKKVQ